MKTSYCWILILIGSGLQAQSKQVTMMLQQIAANAAHIQVIEKGYAIAKEGLQFIGEAKNGEFQLHNFFFNSLVAVNPSIKTWSRVGDILQLQIDLLQSYRLHSRRLLQSGQFSAAELKYFDKVFGKCTKHALTTLNELHAIINSRNYQLSDEARIILIEQLYRDMQSDNAFEKIFANDALILSLQRKQEKADVNDSRHLNHTP